MLQQHVDVRDEAGYEAHMFRALPPCGSARRLEQDTEDCPARELERPLWKDSALRSVPNMKRSPRILLEHLFEPELIGVVDRALSLQAGSHQFGDVPVRGDRLADDGPL